MARDRRPAVVRPSQRRQQSRWQKEKARQRSIIIAGVVAILFILAIPAYGYWSTFVAPPRSVVLQVDDSQYTLGYMLRYFKGLTAQGAELDMSTEPFNFLQMLEESEIIRNGALGKGILLEPQAVDQEIRVRVLGSQESLVDVPPDQL
ncbi:MAG: Peptidylprolyl isomerase, partial [Dehalococcoidia bacterium]|nr:Peptidylprolyl isomerase [Dehalococcoidia bacterium]